MAEEGLNFRDTIKSINLEEMTIKSNIDETVKRVYDISQEGKKLSYEQTLDLAQDIIRIVSQNIKSITFDIPDVGLTESPILIYPQYDPNDYPYNDTLAVSYTRFLIANWSQRARIINLNKNEFDKNSISIKMMMDQIEKVTGIRFGGLQGGIYASNQTRLLYMLVTVMKDVLNMVSDKEFLKNLYMGNNGSWLNVPTADLIMRMIETVYSEALEFTIKKFNGLY